MANINKIRLSGQTYDIQDPNASKTVELTQAQYDALTVKDPNTFYIITDAQGADLSNYYTKSETSGATEISTALNAKADTAITYTKTETDNAITAATSTKQDTLVSGTNIKTINNESILGSGNITIEGGGGKAITAGRGITVTSGETADTVSFNLPISAGTGTNSIKCGETDDASGSYSFAIGANGVNAKGQCSFAGGSYSEAKGFFSMAFGRYNTTNNYGEVALGFFNKSNGSSSAAGNSSGNTLFSVGNGINSTSSTRHNAFEIRQNGDIYITSGGTDIKLQDNLGGGGSSYTAGDGIDITNDVISVNSGVVTTNTEQTISGKKIFKNSDKPIEFKQTSNSSKVGFSIKNSAATNNEVASFEFRPNTFTIDNVQHPLLYFGHYRHTAIANAGVPQTVIGFRQYDQKNAAAYHYLMPLPEKAKTPFSLTPSFKDYYAPIGFKNGSTMITADDTGVVDLSSELGGLKLKKLTQAEYDALTTKDSQTLYIVTDS